MHVNKLNNDVEERDSNRQVAEKANSNVNLTSSLFFYYYHP